MKLIMLLGCLLMFVGANAQNGWDSTYRPPIYSSMAQQFASFPTAETDIIFLGNSISSYTNWNELLGLTNARNRGIPGDITFGVLERLNDIIRGKPAKVFILIGTNDIARNIPDEVILENYRRIIQQFKKGSPSTRIYFQTLLPVNNTFKPALQHFDKDQHYIAVNDGLRKICIAEKTQLIDLYPSFLDKENRLVKDYSFDGLHLNDKGYFHWARILKEGKFLN